jgi:hypothetical protein
MADRSLRWMGAALIAGGLTNALFWLSAVPFDTFAGAEVVGHPWFVPGQVLHAASAMLTVFGYTGLFLAIKPGRLVTSGYVIAVLGTLFYLADAAIALIVFPLIAANAPNLLEATGPLFAGPVLGYFILFAATNMIGIVLLGAAAWRSHALPIPAAALFIAGGILFNLPPMPMLHLVLVGGGVLWGVGAIWLGAALRQGHTANPHSIL